MTPASSSRAAACATPQRGLPRRALQVTCYTVSPMRKVLQEQRKLKQQRLQLKKSLVSNLRNSQGIVTVSALSLVKSLELLFRYHNVASPTSMQPLPHGFYSQLNVTYPGVMYGSPTTLAQLCGFITTCEGIPVKLLSSTLTFGSPHDPHTYTRRDLIQLLDTGARGYIVQPGRFSLAPDQPHPQPHPHSLTLRSRGFYLVPASTAAVDLQAWADPLLDAKIGLDDLGNAGVVLNTKQEFTVACADADLLVLKTDAAQLHILQRLSTPSPADTAAAAMPAAMARPPVL